MQETSAYEEGDEVQHDDHDAMLYTLLVYFFLCFHYLPLLLAPQNSCNADFDVATTEGVAACRFFKHKCLFRPVSMEKIAVFCHKIRFRQRVFGLA